MTKFPSVPACLAVLAAAVALPALQATAETDFTYDFTGFSELDVAAGIEVVYETGADYSVVAHFRKGGPDDLKIRQDGDRLRISKKSKSNWGDRLQVQVNITSPTLNAIEATSGSSVQATGVNADAFALHVASGGSARVSGTCGDIAIKVSSGGNADARDLACRGVVASASSGGTALARATGSAVSRTSSGGSVDIWGDPADRVANDSISGGSTRFH